MREGDHKKTKEPTNLRQRSPVYPTAEAQRSNGVTPLNFTPFEVGQREGTVSCGFRITAVHAREYTHTCSNGERNLPTVLRTRGRT